MSNSNKKGSNRNKNNSNNLSNEKKLQGRQGNVMGNPYSNESGSSSKRNGGRSSRRNNSGSRNGACDSASNPVSLYTKFDQFARDAAKLPFATPVGAALTVDDVNQFITPGLMRIRFSPSIGVSSNFSSPINRSSIRFYTYLRSNQKASATYDHQDITMMMIALDSCYMFHALMSRVYATVNLFTPANEYYSRAVVAASGVKFDDIRTNLQDFRAYINSFAYSLGQYALPSDIAMFDRHRWMCEGIYTDGTSTKAQTYIFVPDRFYRYDNTVATGSQCVTEHWLTGNTAIDLRTFAEIKEFGDKLLNAISNDEDFAVISGDIYNFYGGKTYTLPYIGEQYSILPKYDEVVLSQIENAVIVGELSNTTIKQDPNVNAGAIIYEPLIGRNVAGSQRVLMNFHHDSPTPDEVIEATRLMVQQTYVGAPDELHNRLVSCGTEIVTGLDIWSRNPATMAYRYNHIDSISVTASAGSFKGNVLDIILMAQFDWAPCLHVYADPGEGKPLELLGLTWDVENAESVDGDYLANIHLASLLSLFTVGVNREA